MMPSLNKQVLDIPEALSIFVNQIVYDKKARGERVYTYSLGEAFFDIPRFPIEDDEFFKGYHYSSSMGVLALRQKIAKLYKQEYGVNVNPDTEILVSAGSKPIIFMLLQVVLSAKEEVLIPEPAWLSYKEQVKLAGGVPIAVSYDKDIKDWANYITPKTKVIIINNPNNPSGKLYSKEELTYLINLAKKYNLFILCDEAYSDFLVKEDKFVSLAAIDEAKENCLIVNSLSKNMGMSGWRVGYAICNKKIIEQLLKLNQHLITCTATVLQNYMAKYFDEILSYTLKQARAMAVKRKEVQKILDKVGIKALEGKGTFYFMLDVSKFTGTTDELVYDLLLNHNIATVAGNAYGNSTKNFIRFAIGVENLVDIEKSLQVIKQFLDMPKYDNTKIRQQMKDLGIING